MNNRNRRESLFNLIFTVGLFLTVVIFAIVEIVKFSTIKEENSSCKRDGIWLIDSTGKSTYVKTNSGTGFFLQRLKVGEGLREEPVLQKKSLYLPLD